MFNEQTKHVNAYCYFIRQKLQKGVIDLKHIKTREQPIDLFIKAPPRNNLMIFITS